MEWITLVGVGGGASIITVLTFWMKLSADITDARSTAKAASEKAHDAELLASAAIGKTDLVNRQLHEYHVEASSKIAGLQAVSDQNTKSLIQSENRLSKSIDDLGKKMDELNETIINMLSKLIGGAVK